MTTYRLPEALGGGEYEALTDYKSKAGGDWRVRLIVSGVGLVDVPTEALTEVKPPIPAEPEPGVWDIGGKVCARIGSAWAVDIKSINPGWWWKWPTVWERLGGPDVTVTPLVPSVPVEPVQLPWEGTSKYEAKINVERYQDEDGPLVQVRAASALGCGKSHDWLLSPPVARAMAAALLFAADRSDQ